MVNKDYNGKRQREKEISKRFQGNGHKEYSYGERTTKPLTCDKCDGYDMTCGNYKAQSHIYVTVCKTKYNFGFQIGELERKLQCQQ